MENREGIGEGGKFEEIFNFRPGEFGRRETTEDLTLSLQEIQKMDAVLKIKVTEEKRAKLSRIQAEEESRDILSKLPSSGMPDRIKINLEKFMKLLNEVEMGETDMPPRLKPNEEIEEMAQEEPNADEEAEKEEKSVRRRQNLAFVERNIRLAKCGRGTLSLTDEEKSRIENLLADVDDPNSNAKATENTFENEKESYGMDKQTKSILSEIDRRLELLTKSKPTKKVKGATTPFEKSNAEEEEENDSKEKKDRKKADRLEEINKLLNSMNVTSEEEIPPLSEEEIGSLVQLSKDSLTREDSSDREKGDSTKVRPPPNVMTELVSDAKSLMPKFKYRFDDA